MTSASSSTGADCREALPPPPRVARPARGCATVVPCCIPPRTVLTGLPSALVDPVRLFRGTAVERRDWDALGPLERRRLVVRARAATLQADGVVSHGSAAALWGSQTTDSRLAAPPVDIRIRKTHLVEAFIRHAGRARRRRGGGARRHPCDVAPAHVVDLVHTVPFEHAVVVLDHVLRRGERTKRDYRGAGPCRPSGPAGITYSSLALGFADPGSESPASRSAGVTMRRARVAPSRPAAGVRPRTAGGSGWTSGGGTGA